MSTFQIMSTRTWGPVFADQVITTSVSGGRATVGKSTVAGVSNPLGFLPILGMVPIGQGSLELPAVRTPTRLVSGPLEQAVQALHGLAAPHSIDGILLSDGPTGAPMVRETGDTAFSSSTKQTNRVGRETLRQIQAAALQVQHIVNAGR